MTDDDKALAKLLRAKQTYTTSAGVMEEWINPDGPMAADRIEAQAAEIERLREALRLANIDAANELAENTRLRAALGETE